MIKEILLGKEDHSEKKDFIWNMIGSGIFSIASVILTYMTIRIIGADEGGIFSIGLTLAQMFIYIAYYEMRNFQVTDVRNKYTFGEYHSTKIICCIIMGIVSVGYVLMKGYSKEKAWIIILICIYRMLDGYADVFESQFHKENRLDLAGKSMTYRTLISVVSYFTVLILSHDLFWAMVVAVISGVIGVYIFDILLIDAFQKKYFTWNKDSIIAILKDCFPLFVGTFLWTYLLSASRIAVDNVLTSEYQSYYQVLFMPVSVINLLATFLIRPSLVGLSEDLANGNSSIFWKKIKKILLILSAFTIVCMLGAYVCGTEILSIVVGIDLKKYRELLTFLIFSGGLNAIAVVFYNVLTIFRKRKSIMMGYIAASIVAACISNKLTVKWELMGAGFSYFVSVLILVLLLGGSIYYNAHMQKKAAFERKEK